MRTVKEVSKLTGISVRTLHWYDEIGLLKPTDTSEAGYRLYDDKALEILQQILFFREFDMPLKEIKAIMENPGNAELLPSHQKRMDEILQKLAQSKEEDVNSFEIKKMIGEYEFVSKQMFQMDDVKEMMLELAEAYLTNEQMKKVQDSIYGEGFAVFLGQALKAYFEK